MIINDTKMGRGKHAEKIVKKMLTDAGFEVYNYGYEYTVKDLAMRENKVKGVAGEYLRHMPDFVIVNKTNYAFFIEVKFRYKNNIELEHIFNYPNCYVILVNKNGFLGQSTSYLYRKKADFTYLVNLPPFKYMDRKIIEKYAKRVRRDLGDENLFGQIIENAAEKFVGKPFNKKPLKPRGKTIVNRKKK